MTTPDGHGESTPALLAATWTDGVFIATSETRLHELAGRPVRALATGPDGVALAIVDGHSLCRRASDGSWSTLAASQLDLSCLAVVGDVIYLGTDDARVLRLDTTGILETLDGFDVTPGRDTWFAGSAVINGERVGPPLGVRSMSATAGGEVLLANVHVGGIPRSTDGGASWQPTIAVNSDVHEVRAHPTDGRMVIAAAAVGFCISRDGGATWTLDHEGLHAPYCSAVAFLENDVLVAASSSHFAAEGAVYRRPMDGSRPFTMVHGLPIGLGGIVDTGCIATLGHFVAIADRDGNLHASADAGRSWQQRGSGLPMVSSVLLI